MSERTSYTAGTPCWVELAGTPDVEAAAGFYRDLLGWEIPERGDSAELGGYRRAQLNGSDVAGTSLQMQDGQPCEWNTYVSVDDADATVAKIREAGGTVVVEPMDVMGMGKMVIFTDPTGAACGLWEPGTFAGAALVNETGAFGWNELNSRDPEAAKAFYGAVFGWTTAEHEMARDTGGGVYVEFQLDGAPIAGMLDMSGRVPDEVPPHWLVYFDVDDTDVAVSKIEAGGGTVMFGPIDIPAGRFAAAADPQGAAFAVIKPSQTP